MPIFVTVQADQDINAEMMLYQNGLPLLAIHDRSASVMFTVDASAADGVDQAVRWAGELVRAARQFEQECQRIAGQRLDRVAAESVPPDHGVSAPYGGA
jgi:hypothetical protein